MQRLYLVQQNRPRTQKRKQCYWNSFLNFLNNFDSFQWICPGFLGNLRSSHWRCSIKNMFIKIRNVQRKASLLKRDSNT